MWLLTLSLALAGPSPSGETLYAGVAARGPGLTAVAERLAVALGQTLEDAGATDVGSPVPSADADSTDPELRALVDAARAHFLEGSFREALTSADGAIAHFEREAAFLMGPAWGDLAEALVLRSLSLGRLERDDDAREALLRLAALLPDATLDPEIAPPKVTARYDALLAELRRAPRAQLEVISDPPGAEVVVDGRSVGHAPLVVRDLLPGTHYVGLTLEGERVGRRITVPGGATRIRERVGDPRVGRARVLRESLGAPLHTDDLRRAAARLGSDVVVGCVSLIGERRVVVVARAHTDALVVVGAVLPEGDSMQAMAAELAVALLHDRSGWVGEAPPGAAVSPQDLLSLDVDGGGAGGNWLWLALAVGAGAVVTAAGIAGVFLAVQPPVLEVAVDASRL